MIVTKIHLLGANNKSLSLSFNGEIEDPYTFIRNSEYSDYFLVNSVKINLGECRFSTPKELKYKAILSDIVKDLDSYLSEDGIGNMTDAEWRELFIERVAASIQSFEN